MKMTDYTPSELCFASDERPEGAAEPARTEPVYTIGQLAERFGITLRTLRFYESQGLLAPARQRQRRLYSRADVDRLAVILRAKKLGFSLAECRQMIAAEASHHTLELSREKCLAQIAILEQKLAEITEAIGELRRICNARTPN
jgi:DNA-binding transcriptional MerR regulator